MIQTRKKVGEAYRIWFFLGIFGFHHFYLENYFLFVAYFLSFGLLGFGSLYDAFVMKQLVNRSNKEKTVHKNVSEAFICWLPFGGLFGLHHYYLSMSSHHFSYRRFLCGILYTLTFGVCGIGWLIDFWLMFQRVEEVNRLIDFNIELEKEEEWIEQQIKLIEEREKENKIDEIAEINRRIREEQDVEFLESLMADQLKDQIREEELRREERKIQKEREAEQERIKHREEHLEVLKTKIQEFPEEPSNKDDRCIALTFQLPNGKRLRRCFLKEEPFGQVQEWANLQFDLYDYGTQCILATHYPLKEFNPEDFQIPIGRLFSCNHHLFMQYSE